MEISAELWEAVVHQGHVCDGALYKLSSNLLLLIFADDGVARF